MTGSVGSSDLPYRKFPPHVKGTIQTRSEEGGLDYFLTLHEAFEEIERLEKKEFHKRVWKVSYESLNGESVRMIRNTFGIWENKPLMIAVIMNLDDALRRLLEQQRKDVGKDRWPKEGS